MLISRNKPSVVRQAGRALLLLLFLLILLRLFFIVPARVLSASMMPSLQIGDILLVNKMSYGLWLPFSNIKIMNIGKPDRGDVILFAFPGNKKKAYLKRVIGLPGDVITLQDHTLSLNGRNIPVKSIGEQISVTVNHKSRLLEEEKEMLPGQNHAVLFDKNLSCNGKLTRYEVPAGRYFVLGDNRQYSFDSRAWGFVPEKNLIGHPFVILFSWNPVMNRVDWSRTGMRVQ
ncbi:MAG TPA: signal peptidase I [Desulfobulbaceae bacterium]|nr:signal peptidase I [Desulfobulbaceae bacterium]